MGLIRTPRTQQPQTVASLIASLADASALLLSSVGARDLITGEIWTPFGTTPVQAAAPYGSVINTIAGFGGLYLQSAVRNLATAAQTHLIVCDATSTSGNYAGLVTVADGAGANQSLGVQDNVTANFALWANGNAITATGLPITGFDAKVIVVTGDAAGSALWINGVLNTSTVTAPGVFATSRVVLCGERTASATYATKGRILLYAGWNRRLPSAVIAGLGSHPSEVWRNLRPLPGKRWAGFTAAGNAVGTATETDTSLALAGVQIRAAGLSTETDTALALTVVSARATGVATESDTALALLAVQRTATGLATEVDTALARAALQILPVGLSIETDTALALVGSVPGGVGLAAETNTALALAGVQRRAVGLATEACTALALTVTSARPTGLALEINASLALAGLQRRAVGLATETNAALPLAAISKRAAGLSLEIDVSLALLVGASGVGMATETDTAFALVGTGGVVAVPLPGFELWSKRRSFEVWSKRRITEVKA